MSSRGLSPRVRGNRPRNNPVPADAGSIPARAGEPIPNSTRSRMLRVYPRACGGTEPLPMPRPLRYGLSPRVRGNLTRTAAESSRSGSIPARAGEPQTGQGHPD